MDEGLAGESDASPAEIAEYYDAWAASGSYDDELASWGYEAPRRVAAQVAEHLARQSLGGAVLDAGCGTGLVGDALRALGVAEIVGGDFTPASVEAARERGAYRSVDHLDLNKPLPFANERFAAVTSVGVFSYIADTAATIDELLRVTSPGGMVVFTQRTDLWDKRQCDEILASLADSQRCSVSLSEPLPYLPGHHEFATKIGIIYTTLITPA